MEPVGNKNLKELIVFFALLGNGADKAAKDGLQVSDVQYLMPGFLAAPEALGGIDQVGAEFADLDEAERMDIVSAVAAALVLEDKQVEALVEKAFAAVMGLVGIYQDIKALGAE